MEQWYVKIDDGTIYGPVDTETLKAWAAQGRVEPTSELSSDQEHWFPAERMRELQMDWVAALPDGSTYGPFNICLLPELRKDGVLPAEATLRQRHTGETHGLDDALPDPPRTTSLDELPTPPVDDRQQDLFAAAEPTAPPTTQTPEPDRVTQEAEDRAPQETEDSMADAPPVPEAEYTEEAEHESVEPIDVAPELTVEQEPLPDMPDVLQPSDIEAVPSDPLPEIPEAPLTKTEQPAAQELPPEPTAPTADAVSAVSAVSEETVSPPSTTEPAPAISPAEAVGGAMLTQRIQTLQNSASLARSQLSATRKELHEQKAYSTTLLDQLRKMEEDLSTGDAARAEAERALVDQGDRVSLLDSELENSKAQLDQLQEHYDRLQLEAQQQFETLDETRAQLLQQEQQHQEHLSVYNERLAEKSAHMVRTLRTLLRDEDLLDPSIPEHLRPQDDARPQLEQLRTDLEQTQAMYRQERSQVQDLEQRMTALAHRQLSPVVLGVVGALLIGCGVLLGMVLRSHGGTAPPERSQPAPQIQPDATTPLPSAPVGSPPLGDLPPDSASISPAIRPRAPDAPPATWPRISYAGATALVSNEQCRIIFNEGLFSNEIDITPVGIRDLHAIANQLRPAIDAFSLTIEGHTDAIPAAARGGQYRSNNALGQARADVVSGILVNQCSIPANRIITTTAGDTHPPFPNNTAAFRQRNSTVVLILQPVKG
jgi:flagellar motor protein MotB